jgi:7-dehydrocholesterol reductase
MKDTIQQPVNTWAGKAETSLGHVFRTSIGPLLLMLVTPPAAVLFWIVCEHLHGSLSELLTVAGWQTVVAHFPRPTWKAVEILLLFAALQTVLLLVLPGKRFEGPLTPNGNRPVYKLNGIAAWIVTHALFFGCSYGLGLFNAGIAHEHLGPMLIVLDCFALVFCLGLYFKGRFAPSSKDRSVTGNFLWDYYWGVELQPTVGPINLKQLINCRISMMGWSILCCSFAARQGELSVLAGHGWHISNSILVSSAITVVYLFKFFWWESGYFQSLDIMHDRFGFYICWGVLAWVPAVYPLTQQYLVTHPHDWPLPIALGIFLLGIGAIYVNYAADAQRQRVRATQGQRTVWGKAPRLIHARYQTEDGVEHQSLLLVSGWWAVARHFHYVPEITLALAWSLPAGFNDFVPYFYVLFLTILLLDRATRDDKRCARKYGKYWDEYRAIVKWKVLPGIY